MDAILGWLLGKLESLGERREMHQEERYTEGERCKLVCVKANHNSLSLSSLQAKGVIVIYAIYYFLCQKPLGEK